MEAGKLTILIIESLNLLVILVFFFLFSKRLFKICYMSVTNKYLDKNWAIRLSMVIMYILLSASMLAIELNDYVDKNNWQEQLLTSGSIGFSINSLILIMHIIVVSQQLRKQIPCSKLHQTFLLYLFCLSIARVAVVAFAVLREQSEFFRIFLVVVASILVILSGVMFAFWRKTKKTMPVFDDASKIDINTLTERMFNPLMVHQYTSQNDKSSIEKWNLIIPNITVEMGKVHIILQMLVNDDMLENIEKQELKHGFNQTKASLSNIKTTKSRQKGKQHLEIISDHHYTKKEVKLIYLQCSRFDLENRVEFQAVGLADFYRQIKRFFQQLFTIKQTYVTEIFKLFYIEKDTIKELNKKIEGIIKSEKELLVSHYFDFNCSYLSVQIFKHFWIDDHFIFYIQSMSNSQKQTAICYRRYHQFQSFHNNLERTAALEHKSPYKLPKLPKKHIFSFQQDETHKTKQRKQELQTYCEETCNDYNIMTKMPLSRELILNFLNMKNTFEIKQNFKKTIQFYEGLQIKKGNIYKSLVGEEYVTFYQFELYRNSILIKTIIKRFREFVFLHQNVQRWMQNSQVFYKFLVLPEKHLYKSESRRHQNLVNYLQNLSTIKDIYKVYTANKFYNVGYHSNLDNSAFGMSLIKKSPSISESLEKMSQKKNELQENNKKNSFDERSDKSMSLSKQRMSLLIQQLGQ